MTFVQVGVYGKHPRALMGLWDWPLPMPFDMGSACDLLQVLKQGPTHDIPLAFHHLECGASDGLRFRAECRPRFQSPLDRRSIRLGGCCLPDGRSGYQLHYEVRWKAKLGLSFAGPFSSVCLLGTTHVRRDRRH